MGNLFDKSFTAPTSPCSECSKESSHFFNSSSQWHFQIDKCKKYCGINLLNTRRKEDTVAAVVIVICCPWLYLWCSFFPPTLLPWAHSHFFFLLLSSLLFSLPPSFLFLLSQLEVLHYRLSISSKHHGSPAQSSYQALHAYQVLPSFHFVSFLKILFHHIICQVYFGAGCTAASSAKVWFCNLRALHWNSPNCSVKQIWEMSAKVMEKGVKLLHVMVMEKRVKL